MRDKSIKFILLLSLILILVIFIKANTREVTYATSDIDNTAYLVRDLEDKVKAANMLARINKNIFILIDHLKQHRYDKYNKFGEYIDQLDRRIRNVDISESDERSIYTSYSVNKGEELVFCLRSKHNINSIHPLNLVMYVALHEISHVACPEYGHTPKFKEIFAFFTQVAINIGLYKMIDFRNNPQEYCGIIISESII